MIWKPLRGKSGKQRFGALFWVAFLLFGSAFLRLGIEVGPAIAREAAQTESHDASEIDPATAENAGANTPTVGELEQVLRALQARESALKAREIQIEDRMKALEIADAAIEEKMAALVEVEQALSETLALADGASEADLARLTSVYDKMKPKEAAALFEAMDPAFAAGFLARMRPDAAAAILAKVDPQAAYTISVILAGRNASVPKQ